MFTPACYKLKSAVVFVLDVVTDKRTSPREKAAHNDSILRWFASTCRKNGISPYKALVEMGEDPRFDIFNVGITPPIFGKNVPKCHRQPPGRPDTP